MDLEPDPESLPDGAGEDQALLLARVLTLINTFDDVMAAIHGLQRPEEIPRAKEWVLSVLDKLADILEPGIDEDGDDLFDAQCLAPSDGLDPADLPGDDCDMAAILDDDALNAKMDRFLAELDEGAESLPQDHPMRIFCKMLHRGRDGFRKARAVKKARDEFRAGLGLPPVP